MRKANYEKIYSANKNFFGKRPSFLISQYNHLFSKNSSYLDLGCGQSRDLLFMNQIGHKCTGLDTACSAVKQVKELIKKNNLKNITISCSNIVDFDFSEQAYDIINCSNTLQYLEKKEAKKIINKIPDSVKKNGFIIIAALTTEDPSYTAITKGFKSYLDRNELINTFVKKFNIIHYFEGLILDKGHGKLPPHHHGIAALLAQKKN